MRILVAPRPKAIGCWTTEHVVAFVDISCLVGSAANVMHQCGVRIYADRGLRAEVLQLAHWVRIHPSVTLLAFSFDEAWCSDQRDVHSYAPLGEQPVLLQKGVHGR